MKKPLQRGVTGSFSSDYENSFIVDSENNSILKRNKEDIKNNDDLES